MLACGQGSLARLEASSTTTKAHCCVALQSTCLLSMLSYNLTWHRHQLGRVHWMAEVHNGISILWVRAPLLLQRKHHPVHGRLEEPISPIAQQIPDIHQNWREGERVRLVTGNDGHWGPRAFGRQDFQTRLTWSLEKQRDTAVIGVSAGTHILVVFVRCGLGREDGWIPEEAEDATCWTTAGVMSTCEEVFRHLVGCDEMISWMTKLLQKTANGDSENCVNYLEAQREQIQDPLAGFVAQLSKVSDLRLVRCQRGWERLLRLAILEVAEVHSSGE